MRAPAGSAVTGSRAAEFAAALARLNAAMPDGSNAPVSGAPVVPVAPAATVAGRPAGPPTGVTADQVVSDARTYLGVALPSGAAPTPRQGLDCSGLVQRVYADLGIDLPRVSQDQARVGTAVPSLAQARPGDLVCFGTPADHIGIYIGDDKMIARPKAGDVVKMQDVYRTPTHHPPRPAREHPRDGRRRSRRPRGCRRRRGVRTRCAGNVPRRTDSLFEDAGRRYGVAPVCWPPWPRSSRLHPTAVSGAGARGLMQLMPGTARGLGVDPMDPAQAVDGAARLLARTCAPSARCRSPSRPTTPVPAR